MKVKRERECNIEPVVKLEVGANLEPVPLLVSVKLETEAEELKFKLAKVEREPLDWMCHAA
jgi:hypothetical protein